MAERALPSAASLPRRLLQSLLPWLCVAVLWELLSRSGLVSARLMPSLVLIAQAFVEELQSGVLLFHAWASLLRALTGFLLAVFFGVLLGVLMARNRWFDALFEPVFSFGYPVPKIALYPLLVFVLGFGSPSKIALIFMECLFPVALNTCFGIRAVERKYRWSATNMGATAWQSFFKVLVPAAAPTIFSGIRVALPLSMVVVVITEMIGDSRGLGYFISYATASFKYAQAYAGVLTIALIGFALDRSLVWLRNRLIFWERAGASIL
jgi:ABC-type nitrate/sulfonate/bicarbonate transport system permease component